MSQSLKEKIANQFESEDTFGMPSDGQLINPYNAEIFLYKPWRPKGFFQFEIIINVLVSFFPFI